MNNFAVWLSRAPMNQETFSLLSASIPVQVQVSPSCACSPLGDIPWIKAESARQAL